MSARLLARGSAAALALVLAAPTAALADGHGRSGEHGKGADGHHQGAAARDHNPPGNNGTIKIDYAVPSSSGQADSGHANRPHPGCAFQLRMFGFDDDQYGTISFAGQAPTKAGTLLTETHKLLSDDAAGGGKDVDAVYSYTAEQLGLTDTPQAKQGWHVKVSVDAEDAPGGAKHKVFWLSCPTPTPSASTDSATGSTVTSKSLASAVSSPAETRALADATTTGTTAGAAAGVSADTAVAPTTGGEAAAVTGRPIGAQSRGSALPFTGLALGTMIAVALGALGAGALAVRAGRRRTAQL